MVLNSLFICPVFHTFYIPFSSRSSANTKQFHSLSYTMYFQKDEMKGSEMQDVFLHEYIKRAEGWTVAEWRHMRVRIGRHIAKGGSLTHHYVHPNVPSQGTAGALDSSNYV